ncbi:MAG: transglycosylase SLT domain-containing protein, partial [Sphingopyxis terrae]|nr:transglycosylase SLT domain-containing protein [Sphingopyxis terrae]
MPRVQVYQADQVAPAETTGARLRAADMAAGGLAIAQGVANLGRAGAEFAQAQADIDLRFDDTESRKAAQRYQTGAAKILSDFQLETGSNAYSKRAATEEALKKLREEALGATTNDRMRRMANDRIEGLFGADSVKIGEHATRQLRTEQEGTLKSQVVLSGEDAAANWDRPDLMGAHMDTMKAAVDELGALNGWSQDQVRLEKSKAVSAVHKDVVNRMLADDDIDAAQIYLEANADEMNANDELALRSAMKEPLLTRQAQGDFDRAIGTMPVAEGASTKEAAPAGTTFDAMVAVTAQSESGNRERDSKGRLITSAAGAQGKMQVMPGTNTDPGFGVRPAKDGSDAERTRVGRDYLAAMLKRYGGDPAKAWAAYNAGPGAVDDAIAGGGDWLSRLPGETQAYVKKNVAAIGGGAQQSARTWDKAAVYSQIDALADKEGWSPERRERSKLWADKEIARDEQLKARDENQAEREASEWVIANPNFTDISQMPAR